MNNNEQIYNEEEPAPNTAEFDYNREPPLDSATTRVNRSRSKYFFMTLCFLFALVLFYTYLNGTFASSNSTNWFPLIAALVLAILGVSFLRSPDSPPKSQLASVPAELSNDDKQAAEPVEKTLSPFEELVQEALASIPSEFQERMENVMVRVAYEPDAELLERVGVTEGHILLGLYEGVPLTAYGQTNSSYPEIITIYQQTIERYCDYQPERIREQVRKTVLHELAHHFGMGHAEMPIWVQ